MANASRWSLSARQGFLVCGLLIAGLFMLSCGTGMSNIPVAALGIAVGLLGPAVITLSSIRANRPDVFGTAHVSQSSPPPTAGVTGRADLHLLVNAQGVRNVVVRIRDARVPVSKWPDVGATLPVLIPNGNPRRLQVLWDQVRGHHDLAMDDVSYSPYLEEEYVDEGAGYPGYPPDGSVDEQIAATEPVTVDESPQRHAEWQRPTQAAPTADIPVSPGVAPAAQASEAERASEAGPVSEPVSEVEPVSQATTAPAPEAVATAAPPRRRPSPRPRRPAAPADSVEAVVPMTSPVSEVVSPAGEPLERWSGVVEAKPATPAAVERGDPVVPAGGLFIGSSEPTAEAAAAAAATAAAAAAATAGATAAAATGANATETSTDTAEAATVEFRPVDSASVSPPTTGPEPSPPLPRRVPRSARGKAARPTSGEAGPAEPDPYVASYLADHPEDVQQGLSGVHNVSVTVIVSDLRRSLTFYRDLLGLTEIDGGMGSAILVSGNARILLRQVADTRPVDRRVVHLNLEVDDVHEAYERLRREGLEFMHPPRVVNQGEQLEQWAATLRDPDGHAIALTHWEVRS